MPGSRFSARSADASDSARTPTMACPAERRAAPSTAPTLPALIIPIPKRAGLRWFMVTLSSIFTDFYGVPVIFLNTHCWRLKGAEEAVTPAVQIVRRTTHSPSVAVTVFALVRGRIALKVRKLRHTYPLLLIAHPGVPVGGKLTRIRPARRRITVRIIRRNTTQVLRPNTHR